MKARFTTALVAAAAFVSSQQANASGGAAQAGQSAMQIASVAAISSIGTSGQLTPPCSSGTSPASCILLGLAVAQVGMSLLTSSGAKDAANAASTQAYGYDNGTTGVTAASPSALTGGATGNALDPSATAATAQALQANGLGNLVSDYTSAAKAAQAAGIQVSSDGQTVTLPNGKQVASSSLGTPQGMQGAGFSAADANNAFNTAQNSGAAIAAAMKKVGDLNNDVAGGGGGGGSKAPGTSGGGGSDYAAMMARMNAAKKNNNANVAGMSKKLGTDNIGVAGDDIFEMVTRRYQARDKADNFLKK